MTRSLPRIRDALQELRELGLRDSLYRVGREARLRLGVEAFFDRTPPDLDSFADDAAMAAWAPRLPFAAPADVAALRDRIPEEELALLQAQALAAARGRIRCFGRWSADFGHPIDWHSDPWTRRRWEPTQHWSAIRIRPSGRGDVKRTWEVGRFPHAYAFARAAAFGQCPAGAMAGALEAQIRSFVSNNPRARGIHWGSGQELAFRLMAFAFSVGTIAKLGVDLRALAAFVGREAFLMGCHIESQLEFAKRAIYNNHLLSEAVGLLLAAWILPVCETTTTWTRIAVALLDEQAERQVYRDGAYIQQSHNYHRVAIEDYLWACRLRSSEGRAPPTAWLRAMERSLVFLVMHQNPTDGRLPNYGANDGAMPFIGSTCDFPDFRPDLQALSVATRGERLYPAGPWDETAVWFFGRSAVDEAPIHPPTRRSVAFRETGYFVLRGRRDDTFSAFRCGSLRDRFSQIDMLHLDVWWRGRNVLVDGGSYLYSGAPEWHDHFLRTESHNTVQIDGLDQMLHFRQFKCLYWTQARILEFQDHEAYALCAGEHYGFRRHPGACVHRRSVLFLKSGLWVVVDRILGEGRHRVRVHWLGGEAARADGGEVTRMSLVTPDGPFTVTVLGESGVPLTGDVVSGRASPPRGWSSRYYGERVAVPSFAVERDVLVPATFVSVLAPAVPAVATSGDRWAIDAGHTRCAFSLRDGLISEVLVEPASQADPRDPATVPR
jgi:asparagine synthase (glutamine-hydrolysing)